MKKMSVVVTVLSLAVSLFSIANAGNGNGMGGGCGDCAQGGAPSDPFRKFQGDTIDLRQEMMTKRFEMQRENLKGIPDKGKIALLQGDIKAIQSKILDIRSKNGLPVDKCDGECGLKMGGCGKGMGGCNDGPCAGQK
jgi:hypothetical protein